MRRNYLLLSAIAILASCQPSPIKKTEVQKPEPTQTESETQLLSEILTAKKELFLAKADSAKIVDYDNGLEAVEESGILSTALNVGDTAINFTLANQTGAKLSLNDLYKTGPVILTWYRGGWCPYCNMTLSFLQEKLPAFEAEGAKLVALTPELPDSSMSTSEKNELSFDILSDVGNTVAREYGLVFELTPEVAKRYQNGFDLHSYNGDESNELPLAATYIIDTNGVIQYAFLDVDYRNRAEPDGLIEMLKTLR